MADTFVIEMFLIGLMSAPHCSGMCGGIMGALSLSLPQQVQGRPRAALPFIALYNIGRLGAYGLMAAAAAALGTSVLATLHPVWANWGAKALIAVTLVGIGLHLAGLIRRPLRLERLGAPLWRAVEPLGRRLLPVRRPEQALLFGFVWGFLPCGLVYAVLLIAFAAPGALAGAQLATAFWLGSLPTMMAFGLFATALRRFLHRPALRRAVGGSLVAFGLATPFAGLLMPDVGVCAGCM